MSGPAPSPVSFTVDPWDPGYGVAFADEVETDGLDSSTAELNLGLELPPASWRPVSPALGVALPGTVLFLDGVRRIDARVWVHGSRPQPEPGIAASFAAGLVSCDGEAHVAGVSVERGLFTSAASATGITAGSVRYPAWRAEGPGLDKLSLALQRQLTDAEVQLALTYRAQNPSRDDLLWSMARYGAALTWSGQSATSRPTTRRTCLPIRHRSSLRMLRCEQE